ncbi:MAG: transposase, partial [Eubacteriaceae bacterium]|nr:transposase [Eubacteriaceae bacterium]
MAQVHFTLDSEEVKSLFLGNRDEAMAKVMPIILNHLLEAEATEQIGAQSYERSDER